MTEQRQQFINIDECVLAYLDESEQNKNSRYYKCWQLAYRAAFELGLDVFFSHKTVPLPVNANGTVNLPSDYISPPQASSSNAFGELVPYRQNRIMSTYGSLLENRTVSTNNDITGLYHSNAGSQWGIGARMSGGEYTIDNENGVIILKGQVSGNIFLTYMAMPTEEEACYIPIQFKEAVIAYIAWKDIRYIPSSRRGNGGDKEQRRREYYNERRLAKMRYKPFYTQEAVDRF